MWAIAIRQSAGRFGAASAFAAGLILASLPAFAAGTGIHPGIHEGVASCGGSTCHGRLAPTGPVVRQNELMTWQDPSSDAGAHSRAWQVLTEPRGEAIAARLGLGRAENAPACLGCHSDDVPLAKRGKAFQISDGVGCEACHGGSSAWLASHYALKASHADNVSKGMTPLDDPKVRAAVCLDCHFGSNKPGHILTHRIMAAGHPRVTFELDLFGALQSHYDFDQDYTKRKKIPGGVKLWAVGQAMALGRMLTTFAAPSRSQTGPFPDFYFYDCQSCHRPLTSTRKPAVTAVRNPDRDVPLGTPVFDDENMITLSAAVDVTAPGLAGQFHARSQAFHAALARSRASAADAAAALAQTARALSNVFAKHDFTRADTFAILDKLLTGAGTARYTDYAGGAQAVMAIDTLLNAMVTAGSVDRAKAEAIRPAIDELYRQVHDPNTYRRSDFRDALARVATRIRSLR